MPFVYQQAAALPLISFLRNLGEGTYLNIFQNRPQSDWEALLQDIIPDAALCILTYDGSVEKNIRTFQEIVSDLYDDFLSEENREGQDGIPIDPPTYGSIPPLVKFGNDEYGPYTWPADATSSVLGMGCGIVSLPRPQLKGGLLAWSTLGHETGGHDVTHADAGLLDELAQKVQKAVYNSFGSISLANYWARCIDEASADICGYLHMGPSAAIALIGYFRALGDGTLRTVGYLEGPHPIDLLRGYLGAAAVKRLHFQHALEWSQTVSDETKKDNDSLYLVDSNGDYYYFPVSFNKAVASTEVVAETILNAKLDALQGHSLQEITDWKDQDQAIVDKLVKIFKNGSDLPTELEGPGFYAAHVVAAATEASLQKGTKVRKTCNRMKRFLIEMHKQNPTWSQTTTPESLALLEKRWKGSGKHNGKHIVRQVVPENKSLALVD